MATENAVSALGKVLEGHSGALAPPDAARAWGVWAASLPLVEDKVEARAVHAQLVRLLEASDARCLLWRWRPLTLIILPLAQSARGAPRAHTAHARCLHWPSCCASPLATQCWRRAPCRRAARAPARGLQRQISAVLSLLPYP